MSALIHRSLEEKIIGKKIDRLNVGMGVVTLIFEDGVELTLGEFRSKELELKISYSIRRTAKFTVPKDY